MKTPDWEPVERAASLAMCSVLVATLCGCTVLMTEPTAVPREKRLAGISYDDAQDHVERARTNMKAGLKTLDQINDVSVGGVGLGTGGAAIATLARAHADTSLTLLTMGGASYAVNQTSRLQTQTAIYSAGLKRLRCIEQNGYRLYQATHATRMALMSQRIPFEAARNRLEMDLAQAGKAASRPAILVTVMKEAEKARGDADQVKKRMDGFINATDVGFEMVSAVDETVENVNAQVRANRADAGEASGAGKLVSDFVAAHAAPAASAADSKDAVDKKIAQAIGQSEHDPHADRLRTDISQLREQIEAVQALLPTTPVQVASVGACLVEIGARGSVAILPSATIEVVAGGDAFGLNAYTEDGQPLAFSYSGATPSAQQLAVSNQGGSRYSISAPTGAKSDRYTIRFFRANDTKAVPLDPPLVISVTQKAAEVRVAATNAGAKPGAKPGEKPAEKPADKPGEKPVEKPGDAGKKPGNALPIPQPPTLPGAGASVPKPATAASK